MAKRRRNEWDIARILRLVNKNTQFLCRFRYEECAKFEFQTDFIRFWAIAFFSPIIHFVHYFLKRLWDIWATPEKEMKTDKKNHIHGFTCIIPVRNTHSFTKNIIYPTNVPISGATSPRPFSLENISLLYHEDQQGKFNKNESILVLSETLV